MPIARWICRACGGREVPLDHFEATSCGLKVHPDYARAVIKQQGDRSSPDKVHVSDGLDCPRKGAIQRLEEIAVDPLDYNAVLTGTAWHAIMEGSGSDQHEVEVAGEIEGVKLVGKIDRLRRKLGLIEDWKHSSDFALKYAKTENVKPIHRAQLSLYAELVQQSQGWRPSSGIIWRHFTNSGPDCLIPQKCQLMSLVEALDTPVGEYTVRECLLQAADSHAGVAWADLPQVGKTISYGSKTGCDYCSVRSVCWSKQSGAPF